MSMSAATKYTQIFTSVHTNLGKLVSADLTFLFGKDFIILFSEVHDLGVLPCFRADNEAAQTSTADSQKNWGTNG